MTLDLTKIYLRTVASVIYNTLNRRLTHVEGDERIIEICDELRAFGNNIAPWDPLVTYTGGDEYFVSHEGNIYRMIGASDSLDEEPDDFPLVWELSSEGAAILSTILLGFGRTATPATPVLATDSLLLGLEKLQNQITALNAGLAGVTAIEYTSDGADPQFAFNPTGFSQAYLVDMSHTGASGITIHGIQQAVHGRSFIMRNSDTVDSIAFVFNSASATNLYNRIEALSVGGSTSFLLKPRQSALFIKLGPETDAGARWQMFPFPQIPIRTTEGGTGLSVAVTGLLYGNGSTYSALSAGPGITLDSGDVRLKTAVQIAGLNASGDDVIIDAETKVLIIEDGGTDINIQMRSGYDGEVFTLIFKVAQSATTYNTGVGVYNSTLFPATSAGSYVKHAVYDATSGKWY